MLLAGCATVYTGVVTITSVVDTGMKAWAEVSAKGMSSAAVDAKVIEVHNKYREACAVAKIALESYKANGDQAAYLQAFAVVKATAADLIQLIAPLINPSKAAKLQTDLSKATKI
jgi:hypothetical protein